MWKKILVWLAKQIAQAAIEEAGQRIAQKKAFALAAEAEAVRLAAEAAQQLAEVQQLEGKNPFEVLKGDHV